jgi:hypothetical protein
MKRFLEVEHRALHLANSMIHRHLTVNLVIYQCNVFLFRIIKSSSWRVHAIKTKATYWLITSWGTINAGGGGEVHLVQQQLLPEQQPPVSTVFYFMYKHSICLPYLSTNISFSLFKIIIINDKVFKTTRVIVIKME